MLNTLGFSDSHLRGLVFAEAFIPRLVGAIAGTAGAPLLAAVPRRLVPPGVGDEPALTLSVAAVIAVKYAPGIASTASCDHRIA